MKSSMDPTETLVGRPYGGIGFIARKVNNIIYKPIVVNSERITGVQILSNGKLILTVFGVYMPYYNGRSEQIQLYNETIDILQSTIDGMEPSPLLICGDMNASLPSQTQLARFWYRQHPYNAHSFILYDFLCKNDLVVSNFNFSQDVKYTYSNANSCSYIDHVFTSSVTDKMVKKCSILSNLSCNVSDHFPVCTTIEFSTQDICKSDSNQYCNVQNYPKH